MNTGDRRREPDGGRPGARPCALLLPLALLLILAGCSSVSLKRTPPPPGRTTITSPLVVLPAQPIGNYLVIEAKWDRHGPYRFLIDTGSAVTVVTPALARRYPGAQALGANPPRVRVTGAEGAPTELPAGWLRRLHLGAVRFDEVPVVIHDEICAALSAHLGVKIDGVLGFPLFRELLLTLDYPGSRVILQSAKANVPPRGTAIAFDDQRKVPLIPLRLGERTFVALVDSGSDAAFSLNPAGLDLKYAAAPRPGAIVGTIAGDRPQRIARLSGTLALGDHAFRDPIVDLTDELSAIGAGALKYFSVTFDQERDRVMFHRDTPEPIAMVPRRSAGVSFSKTPAYWRIAGVVPGSPAAEAGVRAGDLVTKINGEPIGKWDLRRFRQVEAAAEELVFSFLNGNTETEKRIAVFTLVP